jgi:acetyltransferase-like isoleucine patch superfamily enzyme
MDLVDVGDGTYGINHLTIHSWNSNTRLKIGKYCSIADSVHIFLGSNHNIGAVSTYPFGTSNELLGPREGHPKSNGDINIGNDVWIGSHVSIMSGITIGDGAVIAAFSHVVKDIQPYEIVGGNPARHIRMRFDPETIEKLIQIKWWDWETSEIMVNRDVLTSGPEKFLSKNLRPE